MATVNNSLQQVETYNMADLAFLQDSYATIECANKRFKNFQNTPGQLGISTTFELPPRFDTKDSLIASFDGVEQRFLTLTVDKEKSTSYAFTAQEEIYNVSDYMARFGKGAMREMGAKIETDISQAFALDTYRFVDFTGGVTTYKQLANMLALFRNYGAAPTDTKCIMADLTYPEIVNDGLNQFVPRRNEEEARKWMVGMFDDCDFLRSNLLSTFTAGSEGQAGSTLTVVSFTKNADDAVDTITFSGTASPVDADSVKAGDKFVFNDGVVGQPNLRYLTFVGHVPSGNPVQFRATQNAASAGGQVTVTVDPPLKSSSGKNQNLTAPIAAGMQCSVLGSRRSGVLMAGNPLFMAMPQLPDQDPYKTAVAVDDQSGASMRMTVGAIFGQNQRGTINDCIYGYKLAGEYALEVALPL